MGGDWNLTLNFNIDNQGYNEPGKPRSARRLKELMGIHLFKDVYRRQHPNRRRFTWEREGDGPRKRSRIDFFLTTQTVANNVLNTDIMPITSLSDHSMISMQFDMSRIREGKGLWKLSPRYLKMLVYRNLVRRVFYETYGMYYLNDRGESFIIHCSNREREEFFNESVEYITNLPISIDPHRMLEVLLNNIRVESQAFEKAIQEKEFYELNRIQKQLSELVDQNDRRELKIRLREEYREILEEKTREIFMLRNERWVREGEKLNPSFFALGKQVAAQRYLPELLIDRENGEGERLTTNQTEIESEITKFYANLYKSEQGSFEYQEKFLSYIKCSLDNSDREELCKEVTKKEILIIIKSFSRNRTPGLDGLPIEFYLENWNIIADDFVEIAKYIIANKILSKTQRKGIITITPKDGDKKLLKNWRPISLLCVDYKIISKILARRMQFCLENVIDKNQYCSVPGGSIVNCNMFIRDITYFVNNENMEAAFFKVDWHKAFDMVNLEFLFKVMGKMGFGDEFISLIKMLYNNIESAMLINNHIGNYFPLTRSVRQGCPLSMILYTIYQEPFFAAIRENTKIDSLVLPDHSIVKAIGYADDTNIIIKSDKSLIEVDRIITEFEYATKSLVNRNHKSKIFGMGKWANKTDWSVTWCSIDKDVCNILGIFHCNNYLDSVKLNWTNIYCKIESHVRILNSRKLDLFQRASYVNTCILSKAWYLAHIYPLYNDVYVKVKKVIFKYIWIGNYEPVKRATVCMEKDIGGLGVFEFMAKANSIIVNSFLRSYILEKGNQGLISYYCQNRMRHLIPRDCHSPMIYRSPSPYYEYIMSLINKCKDSLKFPIFKNKELYSIFFKTEHITVETKYPVFNWKRIWKNFNSSKIILYKKEFVYKHLHEVLAVGKRLYEFRLSTSGVCSLCGNEESAIHLFYFCDKVKPVFQCF